ncbi:MAG: SpoIID/LytB domain-containing protein, partial [Firmicutes bacterium]|nr:SpoIID/LytB domain-containing protein [Bacillota bacterium]
MKRAVLFLVGVLLALPLLGLPAGRAAAPEAAPLIEEGDAVNGMIRVWLSSIRGKSAYNLSVTGGSYAVNGVTVANGGKIKVEFSSGAVYVTANGTRMAMGSSAVISRLSGGVKIAEALAPANLYPGDMRFFYSGGMAYVVCCLYIEDYVYGVLPYEMDNDFPLEALKAQAVTARTYAIRAKTTSGSYDVTDTTAHQVFRGVSNDKKRCIQAVDDTWGIVLKANGSYAGAYYSASNGGQTAANNHVWGGAALPYLMIKDDPYDLANARAVKKSYFIYASPSYGTSVSAYEMIRTALAGKLGGTSGSYSIDEITDVLLHTPMYAAPSRLYTRMQASVTYNGGSRATVDIPIFPTVKSSLGLGINAEKNELFAVEREEKGFRVTARRYGHGVGMSQRGAEQMAETGFSYAQILGFYYTGIQRARIHFTTNWPSSTQAPLPAEDAPGIMTEISARVSLVSAGDRLNLRKEPADTSEILVKIPNGAEVTVLSDHGVWCKARYENQTGYVSKAYLKFSAEEPDASGGAGMARVSVTSGSLNLRKEASATADIIGKLPDGARVNLVEKGDVWSRILYNNQTGYVMNRFIVGSIRQPETPAATVPPLEEVQPSARPARTGRVSVAPGTLNLRAQPSLDADILLEIPYGDAVDVLQMDDTWCAVRYLGLQGYVMRAYLAVGEGASITPAPPAGTVPPDAAAYPRDDAVAWVNTNDGDRLNLRRSASSGSTVLIRVPHGAQVAVLERGSAWTRVAYSGYAGYVSTEYLMATQPGETTAAAPRLSAPPQPDAVPSAGGYASAWAVTRDGGSVHLRQSASTRAKSLALVPHGSRVTLEDVGAQWCRVGYGGLTGYIAGDYLTFTDPVTGAPAWTAEIVQEILPP